MNQNLRTLSIGLILSAFSFTAFSQKKFQVNLKFPGELQTEKITIFYVDGKDFKKIRGPFENNQLTISDSFYSKYVNVRCFYSKTLGLSSYASSFFIGDIPASIIFNDNNDTLASPFSNYQLTNASNVDSIAEAERLRSFISSENADFKKLLSEFAKNPSDSLKILKEIKYRKWLDKQLNFVRQNGNQYYSFWVFENYLSQYLDNHLSADTLLKIFDTTFTPELKNSFEGKQVETILKGRINISNNDYVTDFKSVDINNKLVDLKNFKGKYVLINFWASWCGPCIAELPTIRKLNNIYGKNKLVVISVSIDNDKVAFANAIKRYKTNWINIWHDINLINIFKIEAIPQVYLIDPDGKLVYSREEQKDYDLKKLTTLLKNN